nr:two-component regulator propeller domain-containing protein [uncultured Undibacterium sp.]
MSFSSPFSTCRETGLRQFIQYGLLAFISLVGSPSLLNLMVSEVYAAKTPEVKLGNLRFDHVGYDQGFVQQSMTTVIQDRQGFMWFGTQFGLVKYDGYRTTVYRNDPRDPESIRDNFISALFTHSDGTLWIGTQSGLSRFNPQKNNFSNFLRKDKNATVNGNYRINAISDDGAQGLWLATDYGLMHFDIQTQAFIDYRHDPISADSLPDDLVTDLVLDQDKNLWVGTALGLSKLDVKRGEFEHLKLDLGNRAAAAQNSVVALAMDTQQGLWVASDAGLSKIDLRQTPYRAIAIGDEQGLNTARIQSLFYDKDANLWIGSLNRGLVRYVEKSQSYEWFRHRPLDPNSLLHNHVSKIYQDQTGVLWVGARSAGLSKVDLASGGFTRFVQLQDDASGNSDNRIRAIANAGQSHLWLGTYAGGLLRMNLSNRQVEVWKKNPKKKNSLVDDQIVSLWAEKDGRLWIATRAGLSLFQPAQNSFTEIPIGNDANEKYLEKILFDHEGVLWASSRGGLHRKAPAEKSFSSFHHDPKDGNSLSNNWALSLYEDKEKRLWIGTMNGLDRFDRKTGTFIHFRHSDKDKDSLSHNRVNALFEDSKSRLWVGTSGGLNRMIEMPDGSMKFQFYPTQSDGSGDSVGGILEDKKGNIWISSSTGISMLDTSTGKFKNYTAKDGMIQGSFLIGSVLMSEDGTMNFGGWTGLSRFKPEDIRDNLIPPRVLITDFLISNQSISQLSVQGKPRMQGSIQDAKEVSLNYRDTVFTIEFAAIHFADPMANRYAYRLEGFEDKWVERDEKMRFATYTNLDPGDYVFRVKASNKNGVWNEEGAALKIRITPPVWKTLWFRLVVAVLVLSLAYVIYMYRVRQLMQQRFDLKHEVENRTKELQNQKASLEKQKESVENAHRNISLLSDIGKEITAKLDEETIMQMLYRNVNDLMDASVFGVGFYLPEQGIIDFPYVMEVGKRHGRYSRDLSEKNQLPVWCIENKKEVFINDLNQEYKRYISHLELTTSTESFGVLEDGTVATPQQSLLYVPIIVNHQVRGVISVHSYKKNAYQVTDLDVLRTLASYVGIALDNADAYRQLQVAQNQLVEREKLAALGALVAGVAHELNTPLGNSLLIASSIEDQLEKITEKIGSGSIKRSDFKQFTDRCHEACVLLMRSLETSANLVSSFKQVAVDQASAQSRPFNLYKTTQEIVATMMNQVRQADHQLVIDIPLHLEMHSYPGPYGQVLINLLQNALLHGFDGTKNGLMRISATELGDKVQICFEDNGKGISQAHIGRIFEPFFTTKLGHGGSGLGLNVTYNIVTSLLGGQIKVDSVIGHGTVFTLELPIHAWTPEEIEKPE